MSASKTEWREPESTARSKPQTGSRLLMDEFVPHFDVAVVHSEVFRGPPADCYRAATEVDLFQAPLVRALLGIRAQPRRVAGQSVPSVPSFVAWRCTCWRPSSTGPVLPELAFSPESGHVGRPRPARGSSARSRWPSDSSWGSSAGWGPHTTLVAIARASVVGRRHGRHEDPQRRTEGEVEHQVRSRCAVRSGSATSSTIRRNRAGSANSMSTATAP